MRSTDSFPDRYGKNSYALVTGGTDGIGLAYCKELAKLGFNIIIVSRSLDKLANSKAELEKLCPGRDVRTVQFDFNEHQSIDAYKTRIMEHIKDLDISLLIQNAGYAETGPFKDVPMEEHQRLMNVNCVPASLLTKLLLDKMRARAKNGIRSGMIFLSSVAAVAPMPGFQTYSATKVYNDFLAKGLWFENKACIDVMSHRPAYTSTKMTGLRESLTVVSPEASVKAALPDLPYENETYGPLVHEATGWFMRKLNELVPGFINNKLFQMSKKIWAKNQKKK